MSHTNASLIILLTAKTEKKKQNKEINILFIKREASEKEDEYGK